MPHVFEVQQEVPLCYLLGITNFDPIKENIVLSRFVNTNIDMPDIGKDVHGLHKETFQKIYKKFENTRISNHNMYSHNQTYKTMRMKDGNLFRNFKLKKFSMKKHKGVIDNTKKLIWENSDVILNDTEVLLTRR